MLYKKIREVKNMAGPKYFDRILKHKHALLFAGGVATAIVAKKVIDSKIVKDATTDAVAGVMAIKKDAEDRMEEIRSDAEAIVEGEAEEEKVEIEVE